ncbi:MAG: hypothetical protein PHN63_03580 [Candidatus Omnitrophica bacterium]|nr:hypothetical protein [Candidatus Omnitrophota bacterium]
MKVLVVIRRSPEQRFLIRLHTDRLIKKVAGLIGRKRHSQAIILALAKGRFEKEVFDEDLPAVKADLILTEHNVCWDLKK